MAELMALELKMPSLALWSQDATRDKIPSKPPPSLFANINSEDLQKDTNRTAGLALESSSFASTLRLRGAQPERKFGLLNQDQMQFWKKNGYLVISNALSEIEIHKLLNEAQDTAETLLTGDERVRHHVFAPGQDSYVSPAGRVLATLNQNGFDANVPPLQRIQRLGSGVHRLLPRFRAAVQSSFHEEVAASLGYEDPRITQSIIIVKAASVVRRLCPIKMGAPVSLILRVAQRSGSHRTTPITRRCRRNDAGQAEFVTLATPVYAEAVDVTDFPTSKKDGDDAHGFRKLSVKAGTLVLMHGNLIHTSEANRSANSRIAFNFGVVEGTHAWLEDNYLQPYEGESEFEKLQALG
ncbi:hypothetical protein OPT61_g2825 [Boeremia exigua]|uniref:Uncharacterized protein n=1 Tax=Boeremia exigua TaxID=749465 RepID=A0ACC2IK93_9PLEO|nr:hypothetical protein OPT61_g2825 [Boeremia exigua]